MEKIVPTLCPADENDQYEKFVEQFHINYRNIVEHERELFKVDCEEDLFELFLNNIPEHRRQHYNCNTCKKFIRQYGKIVALKNNEIVPVLWDSTNVPELFVESVEACNKACLSSNINSFFFTSEPVWGTPTTGDWHHLFVVPPEHFLFNDLILSAHQYQADKNEEVEAFKRFIYTYPLTSLNKAYMLTKANNIINASLIDRKLEALIVVKEQLDQTKNKKLQNNIIWKFIASTTKGFGKLSSSLLGSFVKDIHSGALSEKSIVARYNEKSKSENYMRPDEESITEGNIKRAEELFAALGLQSALKRKVAMIEEILPFCYWQPSELVKSEEKIETSLFGHLNPNKKIEEPKPEVRGKRMNWRDFKEEVLPSALKVQFYASEVRRGYMAVTSATDPEAGCLLKWDKPENRNPFSLYCYAKGSVASDWLDETGFVDVLGICNLPHHFTDSNHGPEVEGSFFILKNCRDKKYTKSLALFPSTMIPELHEVRKTIEAFSAVGVLDNIDKGNACGFGFMKGFEMEHLFKVETKMGIVEIVVDRW